MNEIQDRIFLLVKTKNFTSAEFAESIGVQPSNISHIMSGRNKPSLDLVMKILKKFPEIRSEWLLNGQGMMTKDYNLFTEEVENPEKKPVKQVQQQFEFEAQPDELTLENSEKKAVVENVKETESGQKEVKKEKLNDTFIQQFDECQKKDPHKIYHRKIEKIVVFYEDRTFREYSPEV